MKLASPKTKNITCQIWCLTTNTHIHTYTHTINWTRETIILGNNECIQHAPFVLNNIKIPLLFWIMPLCCCITLCSSFSCICDDIFILQKVKPLRWNEGLCQCNNLGTRNWREIQGRRKKWEGWFPMFVNLGCVENKYKLYYCLAIQCFDTGTLHLLKLST